MKLSLKKALIFLDLETTGVDVAKDRIVQIALIRYSPDGTQEEYNEIINPEIPIPVQTSEIHGIYDVDVLGKPNFKERSEEIIKFIGEGDFAGFNSNRFDVPLLLEEFARNGIDFPMKDRKLIDVQNIFHKKEERTLAAAMKFYCGKELENAHDALADVRATADVLMAQLDRYEDLEGSTEFLHDFSRRNKNLDFVGRFVENNEGIACFNFGKHKGKPVAEVLKTEPSYYSWMMQGDFPHYTKKVLQNLKESM
jgi:DNA polymerase-3 subunit epsilon